MPVRAKNDAVTASIERQQLLTGFCVPQLAAAGQAFAIRANSYTVSPSLERVDFLARFDFPDPYFLVGACHHTCQPFAIRTKGYRLSAAFQRADFLAGLCIP